MSFTSKIVFRQLFDRISCTYTYLLGCKKTNMALLIDPVKQLVDRDLKLVEELNLKLKYVLNTHVHADHITGSGQIKLLQPTVKSIISKQSGAHADIHIEEGDNICCGDEINLIVLNTPGHTDGCVSYYNSKYSMVFTGDALLIRGCGRTDFQQGDSGKLYDSVHEKIFTLPGQCLIYPAHDYNGQSYSTINEEKIYNPRLTKSRDEFIELMKNLKLEMPQMIDIALPQNMICGL